jgi:5-(carboxyamino)imidazole ribonucleotide synthase
MRSIDYVGVLAIEFFEKGSELYFNEMAPRVHNSGHWTIEGAEASQFENHLRAVAGLPLAPCNARGFSAMVNLIGELAAPQVLAGTTDAFFHGYDKSPRPGRKLGHITLVSKSRDELAAKVYSLAEQLESKELTDSARSAFP